MAINSEIGWCDDTANLWWGRSEVHEGCDNCYAKVLSNRYSPGLWDRDAPRKAIKGVWGLLQKAEAMAKKEGRKRRVFVGSMMDIFEKPKPLIDHKGNSLDGDTGVLRGRFFNEVVPNSPNLIFLLLTKRPSNIKKYIPAEWLENPPENVMYGTSVSMQKHTRLLDLLLQVPGRHFVSCEPLLERVDIREHLPYPIVSDEFLKKNGGVVCKSCGEESYEWINGGNCPVCSSVEIYRPYDNKKKLDWVIAGGESGNKRRYINPDWLRFLKSQCMEHNAPYFMKQIDKVKEIPDDLKVELFPEYHSL